MSKSLPDNGDYGLKEQGSKAWSPLGFQSQVVLGILQTSLRAHLSWLQSLALARRHRTRAAF